MPGSSVIAQSIEPWYDRRRLLVRSSAFPVLLDDLPGAIDACARKKVREIARWHLQLQRDQSDRSHHVGYYLCYPAQRHMVPPLRAFIDAIRVNAR